MEIPKELEASLEVRRAILQQKLDSFKSQAYEFSVNIEIFEDLKDEVSVEKYTRMLNVAVRSAKIVADKLSKLPKPEEENGGTVNAE